MDHVFPRSEAAPQTRTVVSDLLTIRIASEAGVCLVRLEGELDVETAPALTAELTALLVSELDRVTVDLDGLSFMDSSGLGCLIAATTLSRSDGDSLRIIEPREQLNRLIKLTRLDAVLPLTSR